VDGADMMGLVWVDDIKAAGEPGATFLTTRGNASKTVGGILDAIRTDMAGHLKWLILKIYVQLSVNE
jgi:hypothetical protein